MQPSATKNKVGPFGQPFCVVELGDILFFGGTEFFEVTGFNEKAHPMSGEVDLFELDRQSKSTIVFEK